MSRNINNKIVVITSQAFSLLNFRLELMKDMISRGYKVYAMAPDYSKTYKIKLKESELTLSDCVSVDANCISMASDGVHLNEETLGLIVKGTGERLKLEILNNDCQQVGFIKYLVERVDGRMSALLRLQWQLWKTALIQTPLLLS